MTMLRRKRRRGDDGGHEDAERGWRGSSSAPDNPYIISVVI